MGSLSGRCTIKIEISGEPFTFSEVDLPAAIRGLRLALGKSPEAMARILGCSSAGYQKWEQGTAKPDAEWLLRLLQLCPDEGTRNAFRIRAERRSRPRETPPDRDAAAGYSRTDPQIWRDAALSAIDTLWVCAAAGDNWAGDRLRQFADNLRGAAEYFRSRRKPPSRTDPKDP